MKTEGRRAFTYITLGALTLFFCWLFCGQNHVFASRVDWISQHSVLPDYFRQQFYETGQLFPEFAANIGGGQNIYNFSYYGLYSPVILFSYLFPFVKMGAYIMAASCVSLAASVLLLYRWLTGRKISRQISFLTAVMYLLAGPMIFHSYRHIMFVNYMPFLCMALLGIDQYFEKKKTGLYTAGVFLMVMSSFYFSIGGMLALLLYGSWRYFEQREDKGEKPGIKVFSGDGLRFVLPMFIAVLMAGVLLVPTAMALPGGRMTKEKAELSTLFVPNVPLSRFLYSSYGIGLNTFAITVLFTGLTYKKSYERAMAYGSVILLTVPVFTYLLNGGLYIRDKALIPFLPILCYLIAYYLEKQKKLELSFAAGFIPFLLTLAFVYLGRNQEAFISYWKWAMADGIMMACCFLVFWKKRNALFLLVPSLIILFLSGSVIHFKGGELVSRDFYERITDPAVCRAVNRTLEEEQGFYRMEQMGNLSERSANQNRVWTMEQYLSSVYSSACNEEYRKFRSRIFGVEEPFRNYLMQPGSDNPVFLQFMGVKYAVSDKKVPGYDLYKTEGMQSVYKNKYAAPIAYATDRLLSEAAYDKLEFPYNQMALLSQAVTKEGLTDFTEEEAGKVPFALPKIMSGSVCIKKNGAGYHIRMDKEEKVRLPVTASVQKQILFLKFRVKNNNPSKEVSVQLEGEQNKLSAKEYIYYNDNISFTYAVLLEGGQKVAELLLGKGDYEISEVECFLWEIPEEKRRGMYQSLYQSAFVPDKERTQGNRIAGEISVEKDGYFITTIPYDSGFEVRVDGEKMAYEKVNKAFLGFPIKKGAHEVEILYHAPGAKAGKLCSLAGILLLLLEQAVILRKHSYRI